MASHLWVFQRYIVCDTETSCAFDRHFCRHWGHSVVRSALDAKVVDHWPASI